VLPSRAEICRGIFHLLQFVTEVQLGNSEKISIPNRLNIKGGILPRTISAITVSTSRFWLLGFDGSDDLMVGFGEVHTI
jgi:hypothetical protein